MEHYKNTSLINIKGEIWKDINGFEGLYQVSNFGRIKSLYRVVPHKTSGSKTIPLKIAKGGFDKDGYRIVSIWKDNQSYTKKVHRLVAEAFLSNPNSKPEVNHKNGIKYDNRDTKLEWATESENQIHSYVVLKRKGVHVGKFGEKSTFHRKVMCTTLGLYFSTIREAGNQLNANPSYITNICKGRQVHTKGLVFRYV